MESQDLHRLLNPSLNHEGDNPECEHKNSSRKHLGGSGHYSQYLWRCHDCGESEVEGYEGD